jgi:FAD/FMN-containing dehydrogenase
VAPAGPFDAFVRGERATLAPWTGSGAYVNYADPSITDYASAYWSANYPRLQSVKKQYDPAGLFTFAQSVKA